MSACHDTGQAERRRRDGAETAQRRRKDVAETARGDDLEMNESDESEMPSDGRTDRDMSRLEYVDL